MVTLLWEWPKQHLRLKSVFQSLVSGYDVEVMWWLSSVIMTTFPLGIRSFVMDYVLPQRCEWENCSFSLLSLYSITLSPSKVAFCHSVSVQIDPTLALILLIKLQTNQQKHKTQQLKLSISSNDTVRLHVNSAFTKPQYNLFEFMAEEKQALVLIKVASTATNTIPTCYW